MRIGIVSDIHGNMAGLLKAVELMGVVDELLCLGDTIYDYRFSNEVVGWLRDNDIPTILGNHEWGFLGPQGARARAASWVDQDLVAGAQHGEGGAVGGRGVREEVGREGGGGGGADEGQLVPVRDRQQPPVLHAEQPARAPAEGQSVGVGG